MATINRSELIKLLDRLGADHSDTVLDTARALHGKVNEAGLTWDELLRTETDAAFGGIDGTKAEPIDVAADNEPTTRSSAVLDTAEAARLIDRMLARMTISETLREELGELKGNIAKGEFDAMDAHYIGALAKRLGA